MTTGLSRNSANSTVPPWRRAKLKSGAGFWSLVMPLSPVTGDWFSRPQAISPRKPASMTPAAGAPTALPGDFDGLA